MYPQGLGQQQDLGWAEIRTIKEAKKRRETRKGKGEEEPRTKRTGAYRKRGNKKDKGRDEGGGKTAILWRNK